MKADYISDARFIDIGMVPSQFKLYPFKDIYARPFTIQELLLVNASKDLNSLVHTYRAVDIVTSCDLDYLTDGDLAYLMAWLRLYSYPKAPINAIWTCKYPTYFDSMGKYCGTKTTLTPIEIRKKHLIAKPCGKNNVYMSHGATINVKILDQDLELPEGVDFPRAGTLLEAEDFIEDNPHLELLVPALRCIKHEGSLAERYELAKKDWDLYLRADEFSKQFNHGVEEIVPIECLGCNARDSIRKPLNIKSFLYGHNEESVYDMQYNLMSAFNINPDDLMPSKRFLYHHACLVKDMRERKEKAQVEKEQAAKNKVRRRR